MKKFMAVVLALVLVLSLVGCKTTNEAEHADSSITEEILDGGADIALDTETEPEDDATVPEIMNGVLDGGADIGVDAAP